jgi:hypothetical protein
MLASLAFFERLRLRVAGIFLTEALVILGAISWVGGSSSATAGVEGASTTSFCGSSSSLQKGNRFYTTRKKERKNSEIVEPAEILTMP